MLTSTAALPVASVSGHVKLRAGKRRTSWYAKWRDARGEQFERSSEQPGPKRGRPRPHAGYPLRGRLRGPRSLRVAPYRIIHQLSDQDRTVRVAAIRHRSIVYRTDPR